MDVKELFVEWVLLNYDYTPFNFEKEDMINFAEYHHKQGLGKSILNEDTQNVISCTRCDESGKCNFYNGGDTSCASILRVKCKFYKHKA